MVMDALTGRIFSIAPQSVSWGVGIYFTVLTVSQFKPQLKNRSH